MSTDYRALCAELVQELERYQSDFPAKTDKMAYRAMAADDVLTRARAALAQPEAVGPTDEELKAAYCKALTEAAPCGVDESWLAGLRAVARYAHPTPQPIPVSERLPGPEDCDEEGVCWFWEEGGCWWQGYAERVIASGNCPGTYSHWLPAHALPLPTTDTP